MARSPAQPVERHGGRQPERVSGGRHRGCFGLGDRDAGRRRTWTSTKLDEAQDYSIAAGITGNEAGYIIRHGKLVYSWGNVDARATR